MRDLPTKLASPGSAAAVLLAAFLLAYAPDAGRGFIKDDFRWIRETRAESAGDVARLFERTDGFYRPVVSLSFTINSSAAGLNARAYGLTNLAFAIADAVLIWLVARRLSLGPAAALLGAAAWAFNFHGINMGVLWISGRTSLLATLFAVATAHALLAGRTRMAGVWCLLALLSKEEAILLPAIVAGWSAYNAAGRLPERVRAAFSPAWPCFAALAAYLALRLRTDAFWPGAAPAYYQLSVAPSLVAENILQYADRALTWPAVAALFPYAAAGFRAWFEAAERRVLVFSAIWLAGTFAVTVCVPSRSSLYVVLPSVGSALAAAAVASAVHRAAPRRASAAMGALALLLLVLLPVYRQRNDRWVQLAELSAAVLEQTRGATRARPGPIVLVDDPTVRLNLDSAFGSLWPDAAALFLPPESSVVLSPPDAGPPGARRLRLEGRRLVPES